MTIPDDVLHRAAEAAATQIFPGRTPPTPSQVNDGRAAVRAALPILREAIVESIIADVERKRVFFGTPMFPYDITEELAAFLRAYLPESETQP